MSSLRRAFTLIEIMATLLLIVIGVGAVLGMMQLALRWSRDAAASASAMPTALSILADGRPGGRTADANDGDGDGWGLSGGAPPGSAGTSYSFVTSGTINGYYVRRTESSVTADLIDASTQTADVSVDVFWGRDGAYVTGVKRRVLRRF